MTAELGEKNILNNVFQIIDRSFANQLRIKISDSNVGITVLQKSLSEMEKRP